MPRVRRDCTGPVVYRTARMYLRTTPAQARRCFGLLAAGGDVWAALLELNEHRFRRGARPLLGYQELCREVAGVVVGELSVSALRSVLRCYSDAAMETARRKRRGERARYPRRRRHYMPLRYYEGTFCLEGQRIRLSVARGKDLLWLRLARPVPYRADQVRSVTLLVDAGRMALDISAEVPIGPHPPIADPAIAGVDLGIIHPYAVTARDEALLVSGRAIRAEERLHLADTKARDRAMAKKKAPRPRRGGSRRWRKIRASQRRAEARHLRRVRQMHHQAAQEVVAWASSRGVGTLVVGDPKGITRRKAGRVQNRRVSTTWRRTHLLGALSDKAELAGITVLRVDERQTSSTCPECARRTSKSKGRRFACRHCGYLEHRDLIGARNIAARGGGSTTAPVVVKHRRAGSVPARRDRRRHLMDRRRSCPAPGRPKKPKNGESLVGTSDLATARTGRSSSTTGEDQVTWQTFLKGH